MRTWQWVVLAILTGLVFWPVLTTPFIQDDYVFLERALEPHRLPERFTELRSLHSLRPLSTDVPFTFLYALFGRNAVPFHLLGLVIHLLAARILWGVLLAAGVSKRATSLGTVLFLFHPIAVWVLMWSSCMQELMSTAFGLLCLLLGLKAIDARRVWLLAALAGVSLAVALLSKETAVVFPGILVILLLTSGVRFGRMLRLASPSWIIAAGYLVYRFGLGGIPMETQYEMRAGLFALLRLADHLAWGGLSLVTPLWILVAALPAIPEAVAMKSDLPTLRPVLTLLTLAVLILAAIRARRSGSSGRVVGGLLWWVAGFLPVIFLSVKHYGYYGYASLGGLILAGSPLLENLPAVPARRKILVDLLALGVLLGTHFQARSSAGTTISRTAPGSSSPWAAVLSKPCQIRLKRAFSTSPVFRVEAGGSWAGTGVPVRRSGCSTAISRLTLP